MISTSAEFQTAVNSMATSLLGKVEINYTDTQLDPTITGTSTDLNYISFPQQMVNGRDETTDKYFELDGIATLDNGYTVCPDTSLSANFNEMGWWSATRSSATGVINVSSQITYSQRKVSGFYLCGDTARNEYAIDFNVKFYSGVTLVYTSTITSNTEVKLQTSFTQISDIDKCVLNITKWSAFNTPVKIAEFTTQVIEIYTGENLCDFSVLEEREISNDNSIPSGNISSSQASICIMNSNGRPFDANNTTSRLFGLIKPNALIKIYIGANVFTGIEWIPVFTGWVTEWDVPEDGIQAHTTARDRLNLLTQTTISTQVLANTTFYDWFEAVLNDAGLSNVQYNIDTNLDTTNYIVPFGWFEQETHRNALEILARGSSSVVYVDRMNIIQVKLLSSFPSGSVQTFTRDDYSAKDNQPIYSNIVNDITVTTSPLLVTTGVTVYETNSTDPETISVISGATDTFIVRATETPISNQVITINPAVTGLVVASQIDYSWGSIVTIQNNNAVPTDFLLKVVASTYVVTGQKQTNRTDATSILDNGRITFSYPENRFLQVKPLSVDIAENLLADFKDAQRDLSIGFGVGGNPTIELGDTITVVDLYQSKDYKIVTTNINFNGSLGMNHQGRV